MLCLDISNSMGEDSGLKCGAPVGADPNATWDSAEPEDDSDAARAAQLAELCCGQSRGST